MSHLTNETSENVVNVLINEELTRLINESIFKGLISPDVDIFRTRNQVVIFSRGENKNSTAAVRRVIAYKTLFCDLFNKLRIFAVKHGIEIDYVLFHGQKGTEKITIDAYCRSIR